MAFITEQDIINMRLAVFGDNAYKHSLLKAEAYYDNRPGEYASYAQRGLPLSKWPRATVPIAREIIDRSASMLFGNAPAIQCTANPALAAWLTQTLYTDNGGQSLLLLLAKCGGKLGSTAVRYVIDPQAEKPVRLIYYSPFEYEVITDDEDREKILGVVTEIRRRSQVDSNRYLRFRELWTETEHISYQPMEESELYNSGSPKGWKIQNWEQNPYGEIPFQIILNRRTDTDPMAGISDIYGLYDLIDRLNIALDDWSQLCGVTARPLLFGKQLTQSTLEVEPGDIITGNLDESDLKSIETNPAYEVIKNYVEQVESMILRSAQSVQVDLLHVKGLGEFSGRALKMLYAPLIQLTEEKRLTYGRGIELLLESIVRAAKRLKVDASVAQYRSVIEPGMGDQSAVHQISEQIDVLEQVDLSLPSSYDITLSYPDPFPPNALDRADELKALQIAQELGMPKQRVAQELARVYGFSDVEQYLMGV